MVGASVSVKVASHNVSGDKHPVRVMVDGVVQLTAVPVQRRHERGGGSREVGCLETDAGPDPPLGSEDAEAPGERDGLPFALEGF